MASRQAFLLSLFATIIFGLPNALSLEVPSSCRFIPGQLKQIDAGMGQVFGVSEENQIFTLMANTWSRVPGTLKHVSVGPAGVCGVHPNNEIFKLVGGHWEQLKAGWLTQVDAGGDQFFAGVNNDGAFCLDSNTAIGFGGDTSPVVWSVLPGTLLYQACGPHSCWGVDMQGNVFVNKGVTREVCGGPQKWRQVEGTLQMVEVGTDGSVFGALNGEVFRRVGVSACNPAGTGWDRVDIPPAKHVSYDLGRLWLVLNDGSVMTCAMTPLKTCGF